MTAPSKPTTTATSTSTSQVLTFRFKPLALKTKSLDVEDSTLKSDLIVATTGTSKRETLSAAVITPTKPPSSSVLESDIETIIFPQTFCSENIELESSFVESPIKRINPTPVQQQLESRSAQVSSPIKMSLADIDCGSKECFEFEEFRTQCSIFIGSPPGNNISKYRQIKKTCSVLSSSLKYHDH